MAEDHHNVSGDNLCAATYEHSIAIAHQSANRGTIGKSQFKHFLAGYF